MSFSIQAERTDTNVPVALVVTKNGGGISGLTVVVQIRDASTIDSYLDFDDDTFQTSGWTTKQASLADLGDGFYALSGGLDVDVFTNLPASSHHLLVEFIVTGSVKGSALDHILLRRDVYDLALALLKRAIADAETLPEFRSLGGAVQKLVNRVRINGASLEIYEADDSTVSGIQTLTTDASADPIVEADTT
jgi:hypothetical protein